MPGCHGGEVGDISDRRLAEILLCSTPVTVFFIAIAIVIVMVMVIVIAICIVIVIGFCQKLAFGKN
jgi:hypothetical protein